MNLFDCLVSQRTHRQKYQHTMPHDRCKWETHLAVVSTLVNGASNRQVIGPVDGRCSLEDAGQCTSHPVNMGNTWNVSMMKARGCHGLGKGHFLHGSPPVLGCRADAPMWCDWSTLYPREARHSIDISARENPGETSAVAELTQSPADSRGAYSSH
jgi:hypothetical protein